MTPSARRSMSVSRRASAFVCRSRAGRMTDPRELKRMTDSVRFFQEKLKESPPRRSSRVNASADPPREA